MCGLECGLWGLTSRVGSGRDGESAPLSPRQRLAVLTGWGGEGTRRVQGARRGVRSEAGLSPPPQFSGEPGRYSVNPGAPRFFSQCPAGISQALPVGSCAFRMACGPPFPGAPPRLTLPPNPRSPGTPHPASSPAWAGPRPEGLHQRACSVSSADPWTEAAALPPGTQDP